MPDFERIDRELAALGTPPEAVQPLLDEYGQRDRSLENVDVVLSALREGRDPASTPPEPAIERPSFLPLGWDAERKSEPGLEPAPLPVVAALEREEITVTSSAPEEMDEPAAASDPPPPEAAAPAPLSTLAEEEPPPEPVDTQESFPPPPADDPQVPQPDPIAAQAPDVDDFDPPRPPRQSRPPRADLQALLDTELDPREFPSTNPPPPRLRSSLPPMSLPPVPRTSLPAGAPSEPAPQDGDFELLVDDDDILEIDEENEA